jgi:hypothetical protein
MMVRTDDGDAYRECFFCRRYGGSLIETTLGSGPPSG